MSNNRELISYVAIIIIGIILAQHMNVVDLGVWSLFIIEEM